MPEQTQAGAGKKEPDQTDTGQSKHMLYYLSFLSSVQGSRSHFLELLIWLRHKVEESGWKQVAACSALTGEPREVLEVYRLPDSQSLLPTLEALGRDPNYRALLQLCKSRQMDLTQGLPYDPGAGGSSGPLVKYPRRHFLQAILTLKADQLPQFIKAIQDVREVFDKKEWSLISASQSLTLPCRVTHLWLFGNSNELGELMGSFRGNLQYAALDGCCAGQWQRLLYALELPSA